MENTNWLKDWSLVQSFLAVADEGSLSAAARRLGHSQPTMGRHIASLEDALGTTLFARVARGLELTEEGAALLPAAREMAGAAARLSLSAAGRDEALKGTVRITASRIMSHYILPDILSEIRQALPQVELELHPSDSTENLLFREADIALRMYRPTQLDVITRHIGDLSIGLYAADCYVARRGLPQSPAGMADHDWVGYDRSELILNGFQRLGWSVGRNFFATRCDDLSVYWELVRAGCGIGAGPAVVARREPGLAPVFPDIDIPGLPIWLTAHRALRRTPRIGRVYDALAAAVGRVVS